MNGRDEFDLIPGPAKILAAFLFLIAMVFFSWIFGDHRVIGLGTAIGLMTGAFAGAYVLLSGYVYADAKRRGMPPVLWTALVVLIPNGVGFVLYFLLRKPMSHPCPRCGRGVAPDDAFCPRCGQPQTNLGLQPS